MGPDEALGLVLGDRRLDGRSLADHGLDSLDALEVLAGLEVACPGLRLPDDGTVVGLPLADLRARVVAHRALGADEMVVVVEVEP